MKITNDERPYLGATIGSNEFRKLCAAGKVEEWCKDIESSIYNPPEDIIRSKLATSLTEKLPLYSQEPHLVVLYTSNPG